MKAEKVSNFSVTSKADLKKGNFEMPKKQKPDIFNPTHEIPVDSEWAQQRLITLSFEELIIRGGYSCVLNGCV